MKFRYRTSLFFVVAAILLFVSCGRKSEVAAEYNDRIISQQMQIIDAFELMDSTLRDTSVNMDRIDYAYSNLRARVKEGKYALDSIGPFTQDPSLQLAAKELFEAYDAMVEGEYRTLSDIHRIDPELLTSAMADSANVSASRILDRSKQIQERFMKAQDEFGKKYNLTFE